MSKKNWIAGAIKHPGALHKQLGVPSGKKIPAAKLQAAEKKGGVLGKRARLAETLKGMHHGMQIGAGGFGITHGEDEDTEGNEHEFRGGVGPRVGVTHGAKAKASQNPVSPPRDPLQDW